MAPTKDGAREDTRDDGAELAGVRAGVVEAESVGVLISLLGCEPGPYRW